LLSTSPTAIPDATSPTLEDFPALVAEALSTHRPNDRQRDAIGADANVPLLVVAGPGTGKTTTLVLRALRFTFVDGIAPEDILITTFAEKAGREIRSRLIEWGTSLRARLVAGASQAGDEDHVRHLATVDVNRGARQFWVMKQNMRCSILFHLEVPGG
jgi:DNA helicase-2/ATP-dependent DNA helicase PcrA